MTAPKYICELTGLMRSTGGGGFVLRIYTEFEVLPNGMRRALSAKCIITSGNGKYQEHPDMRLGAAVAELDRLDDEHIKDTAGTLTAEWKALDSFGHWGMPVTTGPFDEVLATWTIEGTSIPGGPGL
jgi:hypothetical protein